jgi:hypothetical protein
METLQMIQTLTPATMMVALLVLPWSALALMHAMSAGSGAALDDKWNARAAAAVRWAGAHITPATLRGDAARTYVRNVTNSSDILRHAA